MQAHPIIRTFIKDYAMSNLEPTKSRKPSDYELNDEELEKAVGGKNAYLVVTMKDVLISSVSHGSSGD